MSKNKKQPTKIEITINWDEERFPFDVRVGIQSAKYLTYDELLGLISVLAINETAKTRCLSWLEEDKPKSLFDDQKGGKV